MWFRHHWIAGVIRPAAASVRTRTGSSPDSFCLDVWDFAPSNQVRADLTSLVPLLSNLLQAPLTLRIRRCARQPYGSRQCGVHVLVRAVLASAGCADSSLPKSPVADWEALRNLIPPLAPPDVFTRRVLELAAPAAPNYPELLTGAQTRHRYLVAWGYSPSTPPTSWSWAVGTATSVRHNAIALDYVSILPLSAPDEVFEGTLPSPDAEIFRAVPLPAAPIDFECHSPNGDTAHETGHNLSPDPSPPSPPRHDTSASNTPIRSNQSTTSPVTLRAQSALREEDRQEFIPTMPPDVIAAASLLDPSYQPPPHPSAYRGEALTSLQVADRHSSHAPALALRALAPATAEGHRTTLRGFRTLDADLRGLPLDVAVVEWVTRQRARRNWRYSTVSTKMASIAGALRLLPLYVVGAAPISLAASVVWAQAVKAANHRKALTPPKRAHPATWADVEAICRAAESSAAALAILLAWLTCARMADVLRLRASDMIISPDRSTVTFRATKSRHPYTVATVGIPAPFAPALAAVMSARADEPTRPLLATSAGAVRTLLKRRNPRLSQHSLRRGALQCLAAAGVPTATLLLFSGHAGLASLMAYLDDGARAPQQNRRAEEARVLVGGAGPDDDFPTPPSYHRMCRLFSPTTARPPLHMKLVSPMDLGALRALPMGPDTRAYLVRALRWVESTAPYEQCLARGRPVRRALRRPAFTPAEVAQMAGQKHGPFSSSAPALPVFGFGVRQIKGGRDVLRPVWEPGVNDAILPEDLQPLALPTRSRVLANSVARSGDHVALQLDAVSCFDQVPLAGPVRRYFAFPGENGLRALRSLPMGLRPAVEVASAVLWALLDFPRGEGVRVDSYVDNVRFSGPREATFTAVREFVRRSAAAKYTLDHTPTTDAELEALATPTDVFLGVEYSLPDGTRRLPEKALKKLALLRDAINGPLTLGQFAAAMGLLLWAGTVLNARWPAFFHLLRRHAAEAATTTWLPATPVPLSPLERTELQALWRFCAANVPVPTLSPPPPPSDMVVVTDASGEGWGALFGRPGEAATVAAGRWPQALPSSVTAEPEGVWEGIRAALRHTPNPRHITVLTDHEPLVWAARAGRARTWAYNALLTRLASLPCPVTLRFLPGSCNPADAPSRGLTCPPTRLQLPAAEAEQESQPRHRFMT